MMFRAFTVWLALLVLAVMNGAARDLVISRRIGQRAGHYVSTLVLCGLIFIAARFSIGWVAPADFTGAMWIGVFWFALTTFFEFLGGHFLFKKPWRLLLADYNLLKGRVWLLASLSTLAAPIVAFCLANHKAQ